MRKRCWCLCFENRDVVVSDPLKQVVLSRVDLLLEKHLPTGQLLVRKWKIFKAKADFENSVFVSLVWCHLGQRKSLFRVHYRVLQALREKNWQKLFQLHYTQNSTNVIELKHVTRPEPKEQSHPSGFAAVPLDQLPIKYWIQYFSIYNNKDLHIFGWTGHLRPSKKLSKFSGGTNSERFYNTVLTWCSS